MHRFIWDWQRKQCLLERRTQPGAPPTTYGVVWSPFEPDRCVYVCLSACVFVWSYFKPDRCVCHTHQKGTLALVRLW